MKRLPDNRALLAGAAALILSVLAVLWVQWRVGAYRGDLGVTDDSAAHYVSGVMVRQYALALSNFEFHDPVRFAEAYYARYPKLGFGQWPPVFYVIEGSWLLLFGTSHLSIMLLLGLVVVLVLCMSHRIASRLTGPVLALAVVGLLLMRASVVRFAYQVEPDMGLAGVSLAAALAFARYASRPGWKSSAAWSLMAALAILMKGNAFALALVPPWYLLISRRFDLLRRADFWGPVLVVGLLCGPWYWITREIWTQTNTRPNTGLLAPSLAILGRLFKFGPALLAAALAGLAMACGKEDRSGQRTLFNVMAALLLAWIAFHMLISVGGGPRKHLLTFILVVVFSVVGVDRLSRWAGRKGVPRPPVALCLIAGLALSLYSRTPGSAPKSAVMRRTAERIAADASLRGAAILVSSQGIGEGSLIAEMASLQPEPQHYILRASQFLAHTDWYDRRYRLVTKTPAAVARLLDAIPVAAVVIDHRPGPAEAPHHALLERTLQECTAEWELAGVYPAGAKGGQVQASFYRRRSGIRPLARPPRIYSGTLERYVSPE